MIREPFTPEPGLFSDPKHEAAWRSSVLMADLPWVGEQLLRSATIEKLARGTVIRGDRPLLFVVLDGLVRGFREPEIQRQVTFRYLSDGDTIGLTISLAPDIIVPTDLRFMAIEQTVMLRLSSDEFKAAVADDAGAMMIVCRAIIKQMLDDQTLLTTNLFLSVRERVARHLLDLAVREQGRLIVRSTQEEIARAIGSVRGVVSRAMLELRAEGLIVREGRCWVLRDPSGLHVATGERADLAFGPECGGAG